MILVGIFLFGLVAPFVVIFGGVALILAVPAWAVLQLGLPHWRRLSREQRHKVRKTLIWTSSLALWGSIIVSATTH